MQLAGRQIEVTDQNHALHDWPPRIITSGIDYLQLTSIRCVEGPTWLRLCRFTESVDVPRLFEQQTALRIFDRDSKPLSLLVSCSFLSKIILSSGSVVQFAAPDQAHLRARRPIVDHLGSETIHQQPGAVALVLFSVQMPTALVGNSVLVESIRCGAARLTYANRSFSETTIHFCIINIA